MPPFLKGGGPRSGGGIKMSFYYNADLKERAKALRKNMTPQERKLWYDFLRKYEHQAYRQKIINNYIVDFYCPAAKLVIEIDGGQHYSKEQIEYDNERTKNLEGYGLEIIRIPNNEVNRNFYNVCTYIDRLIKTKLNNSSVSS